MKLKKILVIFIVTALLYASEAGAQGPRLFDPAKFQADLEQFITMEAALTPQEAADFFPLYREMRKKQMVFFDDDRRFKHVDLTDDKACESAIRRHDSNDIKMKEIQQEYHNKFLRILPAGKVFRIIRAEDRFHRQMFKRVIGHRK